MPPIDPRLVRARRYPLHAAVALCAEAEVARLLAADADFHVVRKMPDWAISVVHSACSARHGDHDTVMRILHMLIKHNSPVNDVDSIGQLPMHYAVCSVHAVSLVRELVSAGSKVDAARSLDRFTPLHLAAAFGRADVCKVLVSAGADAAAIDAHGNTPEKLAAGHGFNQLADWLSSPRAAHRPPDVVLPEAIFGDLLRKLHPPAPSSTSDRHVPLPSPPKIIDGHVGWTDADGNTAMHVAAWNGDLRLVRALLDHPNARKMAAAPNKKGATPIIMAAIAGQDEMVEELFANKHSKKLLDLSWRLSSTGQTLVHVLFEYCSFTHPKFVLKRKDLTSAVLNAADAKGYSPLLRCAQRNSRHMIKKILANKAVKDANLLDVNVREPSTGRSLLHLLIANDDRDSLLAVLDRAQLSSDTANAKDSDGVTPIECAFNLGRLNLAAEMIQHHSCKIRVCAGVLRQMCRSPSLHTLWLATLASPTNDVNVVDADDAGNTPLMHAVAAGQKDLVRAALAMDTIAGRVDVAVRNNNGEDLLALAVRHLTDGPDRLEADPQMNGGDHHDGDDCWNSDLFSALLSRVDVSPALSSSATSGTSPLLLAAASGQWQALRALLTHPATCGLAGQHVHAANEAGHTCLVFVLLARVRFVRVEQGHVMRREKAEAAAAKSAQDGLFALARLLLQAEFETHGPTLVMGKDAGTTCIKRQLETSKLLRSPIPEEVVSEFGSLYHFSRKLSKKTSSMDKSGQSSKSVSRQASIADEGKIPEDNNKKAINGTADHPVKMAPKATTNGTDSADKRLLNGTANGSANGTANESASALAIADVILRASQKLEREKMKANGAGENHENEAKDNVALRPDNETKRHRKSPSLRASMSFSGSATPPRPDGPSPPPPPDAAGRRTKSVFKFTPNGTAASAPKAEEKTVTSPVEGALPPTGKKSSRSALDSKACLPSSKEDATNSKADLAGSKREVDTLQMLRDMVRAIDDSKSSGKSSKSIAAAIAGVAAAPVILQQEEKPKIQVEAKAPAQAIKSEELSKADHAARPTESALVAEQPVLKEVAVLNADVHAVEKPTKADVLPQPKEDTEVKSSLLLNELPSTGTPTDATILAPESAPSLSDSFDSADGVVSVGVPVGGSTVDAFTQTEPVECCNCNCHKLLK